jgi:hypothetical protein
MSRTRYDWTPDKVRDLVKWWNAGVPILEIAQRFDMTVRCISSKVARERANGRIMHARKLGPGKWPKPLYRLREVA